MATYYTISLTETEKKAIVELISNFHLIHIRDLRLKQGWDVKGKRLESAVNKITNSKPIEA